MAVSNTGVGLTIFLTGEINAQQLAQIRSAVPAADVRYFDTQDELEREIELADIVGGPISPGAPPGRAMLEQRTIHVQDMLEEMETEFPDARRFQRAYGFRTLVTVPLISNGLAIGVFTMLRYEVRPFTDAQIALLEWPASTCWASSMTSWISRRSRLAGWTSTWKTSRSANSCRTWQPSSCH